MAVATQEGFVRLDDTGFTDEELFERVPQDEAAVEKITAPRYSYWHSVFRVFFRKKTNIIILVLFAVIIVFTYVYPAAMGYDRYGNIMDPTAKHLSPLEAIEKFGFSIRWTVTIICWRPLIAYVWPGRLGVWNRAVSIRR